MGTPARGEIRRARPSGLSHPNFSTGLHSKRLPVRYAKTIAALEADANLLGYRQDITALAARWLEVAEQMDTGESGAAWANMQGAWNDFKEALRSGDVAAINALIKDIDGFLRTGQGVYRAWDELIKLSLTLKQLKEAEQQRLLRHQATLTAEQAAVLISAIAISVRRHVNDPETLILIQRDIDAAMNSDHGVG